MALLWGILAFVIFAVALIPCLGWVNWINIPFATAGVIVSVMALARASRAGEPVGGAVGGLVLSLIAVLAGFVRLVLGGFVI
jgi:hypothetical protein